MSLVAHMRVTLRLPATLLFDADATRLSAFAPEGAFGILPNHVDFVSALLPSVLLITLPDGCERVFGIDEGLLVKQGHTVRIVVRRGVASDDLDNLRSLVQDTFVELDDDERVARAALSRLEADMVRRFSSLRVSPP